MTRLINPSPTGADSGKIFDLNKAYFILVAKGQYNSGSYLVLMYTIRAYIYYYSTHLS